jgi:hypothetical protein
MNMFPQKIGKIELNRHLYAALSEKRRHPRIPLRLPTEYLIPGSTKGRLCHTLNIAEGGVLLCLPQKFEIGQRLKIEVFYYFDYELDRFEAAGDVVWMESLADFPREYHGALEFRDLSPGDSQKLKNFISKIFY